MKLTAKVTINGIANGRPFTQELDAELIPPHDDNHYGTGCYLLVTFPNGYEELLDVRYEGTRNIGTLIRRWIDSRYGDNAREITID